MTMPLGFWISLTALVLGVIVLIYSSFSDRKLADLARALGPETPLQTLDRRLAAGEISAEEYQYEKYLLEKKD